MSVLTYPSTNEQEIFRHCTKQCGIITSTQDQQYFALGCMTCSEKFLYFDAFIEHMQIMHAPFVREKGSSSSDCEGTTAMSSGGGDGIFGTNNNSGKKDHLKRTRVDNDQEDVHSGLLEPPVIIKEEKMEEDDDDGARIRNEPILGIDDDYNASYYSVKHEVITDVGGASYMANSLGSFNDEYTGAEMMKSSNNGDGTNYDDFVEEPLLENMSSEQANPSKGKIKYIPRQANPKCACCQEVSKKLDTVVEILDEHKVLLDRVLSQNATVKNIMSIFPINTEEKLKEFDSLLATQSDTYNRQMKKLLGGNVERNLHQIFGQNIIMNFNVHGTFGKKGLRDFGNVFEAIIDVISTFDDSPDKILRAAFQRQKKKYFKQNSRNNSKCKVQIGDNVQEP